MAFVSLTLFNLLRVPLNILPMLLVFMVQASVSLKRINTFMNADELDPHSVNHIEDVDGGDDDNEDRGDDKEEKDEFPSSKGEKKRSAVHVSNGSFSWDKEEAPFLKNIK